MPRTNRRWRHRVPALALTIVLGGCIAGLRGGQDVDGDWPTYGNDPGGTRYSPLSQIDRGNVGRLRVAWTYRTGEDAGTGRASAREVFEATPIEVDGTLYLSTPFGRVIALDPETGAERWTYDPNIDRDGIFGLVTSRGVSTWLDPAAEAGRGGQVNRAGGIAIGQDCQCDRVTSPPAIVSGLVVVGSSIGDNHAVEVERGAVRAHDARTGALHALFGTKRGDHVVAFALP